MVCNFLGVGAVFLFDDGDFSMHVCRSSSRNLALFQRIGVRIMLRNKIRRSEKHDTYKYKDQRTIHNIYTRMDD